MPSFSTDIRPKFRATDVACMARRQVELDDYAYMSDPSADATYADHAHARHVLARLSGTETPRMPLNGPYWSDDDLKTLSDWIEEGMPP
jgi:hypothetical protein